MKAAEKIQKAIRKAEARGYEKGYREGHSLGVLEGKAQPATVVEYKPTFEVNSEPMAQFAEKMAETLGIVSINHVELVEKAGAVLNNEKSTAVLSELVSVLKQNGAANEALAKVLTERTI